jgi:hypothetical protein
MWDEPNAELRRLTERKSDTTKGVGCYRQQDGGHGSRNPLRSRVTTHLPKQPALKMDGALAFGLYSAVGAVLACPGPVCSQRVGGCRGVRGRVSTRVYLEPPLAQILVVVANT